jgi:hypothetical protein
MNSPSVHPFYVQTRAYVDRILVYEPTTIGLIGEMYHASGDGIDDTQYKIFNGFVPLELIGREFLLRILSNEGMLELPARDVFSVPLRTESVDAGGEIANFIVVNDIPGEAEVCFIEFSQRFARMTGIPREIELIRKRPGELKKEWGHSNKELMARGIDPVAQNFISPVTLYVPAETREVLTDLADENIIIRFYGVDLRKPHTI